MTEEEFLAIAEPVLSGLGAKKEIGEEFVSPILDVIQYHPRPVRLHWIPGLGRSWSVTAILRQPTDLGASPNDRRAALERVCRAVNERFPPWRGRRWGPVGLTVVLITTEPIGPDDDAGLRAVLERRPRTRVFPLALLRVNLERDAFAFALSQTPGDLFPEGERLVDAFAQRLRRYVPIVTGSP